MTRPLLAHGLPVDQAPHHFGELIDQSSLLGDAATLRGRYQEHGHVFLRGLVDPGAVLGAREEILLKYAALGEVDDTKGLMNAVAGNKHGLWTANLRAFTESVRTGAKYEAVILDNALLTVIATLLEADVQPYGFRWPRLVRPGEGCGFHCDGPYMSRGTDRHLSAWIPLGHVRPEQSALMILEDSHRSESLHNGYLRKDADADDLVWLDDDPTAVLDAYGTRWLTTTFEPGDVLIFSMQMLHGAFDNQTEQCRLSTDSRYLAAGELGDPRWNGEGELNPHGPGRVFYPGLGSWANADFQDEWKYVDASGQLVLSEAARS